MASLPLLQDGSCGLQNSCLTSPSSVHAQCPQTFKCGTCVAWSPREKNRFTRNSGQCLLDRNNTQFLDCNAAICPYYRPRADSPAYAEWNKPVPVSEGGRPDGGRAGGVRRAEVKARTRKMTREAPPPSPEALAYAAFRDHDAAVAAVGVPVLLGQLQGVEPVPPLLERFRGGTARLKGSPASSPPSSPPSGARATSTAPRVAPPGVVTRGAPAAGASPVVAVLPAGAPAVVVEVREVPIEALWARLAVLRRSLATLDDAVAASTLDAVTRDKVEKDLAGIAGSMTTFNLLFAKKDDGFKGAGKGE